MDNDIELILLEPNPEMNTAAKLVVSEFTALRAATRLNGIPLLTFKKKVLADLIGETTAMRIGYQETNSPAMLAKLMELEELMLLVRTLEDI